MEKSGAENASLNCCSPVQPEPLQELAQLFPPSPHSQVIDIEGGVDETSPPLAGRPRLAGMTFEPTTRWGPFEPLHPRHPLRIIDRAHGHHHPLPAASL